MKKLYYWFITLLSGKPHFIIGGLDNPYMYRWYLVPRNRLFNLYLHKFLRDDDDRALHDHPWWFYSIMIRGGYNEVVPAAIGEYCTPDGNTVIERTAPSIAFRPATHRHRVVLHRDSSGAMKPAWTLILTGRVVRLWGFWCPSGFISWKDFTDASGGSVGKGCGE